MFEIPREVDAELEVSVLGPLTLVHGFISVFWLYVCTGSRFSWECGHKRWTPEIPTPKAARKESTCEGGAGPRSSCWNSAWCSWFTTSCCCSEGRPPYSYCGQGWCYTPGTTPRNHHRRARQSCWHPWELYGEFGLEWPEGKVFIAFEVNVGSLKSQIQG